MHRYKELIVWKISIELVKQVYMTTETYPVSERFGLSQQIRRSAVSIPSNIAEGAGKDSNADFKRFISIANGSCNELDTQLYLSKEIGYIEAAAYHKTNRKIIEIQNMLFNLQRSLKTT